MNDDQTLKALATALNFRDMKSQVISSNVANANTPGYKAKKVEFEQAMARALNVDGNMGMKTNDSRHFNVGNGGFDNISAKIHERDNGEVSEDGNSVNVEDEMADLAKNKLLYDALVQLVNKKLGLMRYTVSSEK